MQKPSPSSTGSGSGSTSMAERVRHLGFDDSSRSPSASAGTRAGDADDSDASGSYQDSEFVDPTGVQEDRRAHPSSDEAMETDDDAAGEDGHTIQHERAPKRMKQRAWEAETSTVETQRRQRGVFALLSYHKRAHFGRLAGNLPTRARSEPPLSNTSKREHPCLGARRRG